MKSRIPKFSLDEEISYSRQANLITRRSKVFSRMRRLVQSLVSQRLADARKPACRP